jgi:hypothetical protein
MLFMPMMAAAALAPSMSRSARCARESASTLRANPVLRAAMAEASAIDQICFSLSPGAPLVVSTLPRFNLRSRA